MRQNLIVLVEDIDLDAEAVIFPSEEEIMGKLSTADVSCPKTSEVAEEPFYDL